MLISDLVNQLRLALPLNSNKFTEQNTIVSATHAAGVVTVVTTNVHDLDVGNIVNIVNCQQKTPISDITTVSDIATATTSIAHDLTLDYADQTQQPEITIREVTISAYDGNYSLLTVPSRNLFTFAKTGSPAQANDGFILEASLVGFSGLKTVTEVVDTTTFKFATTASLATNGFAGSVHSGLRISGALSLDRAKAAYTKQSTDDYWIFVVPDETLANKSRHVQSDATNQFAPGDAFRQKVFPPMHIYYFIPSKGSISGRDAYDDAITESALLFKSILGFLISSPYSLTNRSRLILEGHGPEEYNTSTYIHRFTFSVAFDLSKGDTILPTGDVAFRDINQVYKNENDVTIIDQDTKLDV